MRTTPVTDVTIRSGSISPEVLLYYSSGSVGDPVALRSWGYWRWCLVLRDIFILRY
jgi:hypothetical protein